MIIQLVHDGEINFYETGSVNIIEIQQEFRKILDRKQEEHDAYDKAVEAYKAEIKFQEKFDAYMHFDEPRPTKPTFNVGIWAKEYDAALDEYHKKYWDSENEYEAAEDKLSLFRHGYQWNPVETAGQVLERLGCTKVEIVPDMYMEFDGELPHFVKHTNEVVA